MPKTKKVLPKYGDLVWLEDWGVIGRFVELKNFSAVIENVFHLEGKYGTKPGGINSFTPFFSPNRIVVISVEAGWKVVEEELKKKIRNLKKEYDKLCNAPSNPKNKPEKKILPPKSERPARATSPNIGGSYSDPVELRYGQNTRGNMTVLHNIKI